MRHFKWLLVALMMLGAPAAWASCATPLPFTLLNGTVADASQVMANFNNVWNCGINPVNPLHLGNTGWLELISGFTESVSQTSSLAQPGKQYGLIGAARTSDLGAGGTNNSFGVGGFGICNDTGASGRACWPFYGEEWRFAGTTAQYTQGVEFDIITLDTLVDINPYTMVPNGLTSSLWLSAGKPGVSSETVASSFLGIVNNTSSASKGIVFQSTALNGNNGTTGTAPALVLPKGDAIQWFTPESTGTIGPFIRSDTSTAAQGISLIFTNGGAVFTASDNSINFEIDSLAPGANHVKVQAATGGNPPGITTSNGNLLISSQGGIVSFTSQLNTTATPTGAPVASLCLDSSNNIIKKTTAGSCI